MGDKTGIEWTDTTWNPIRGCSRVSEGCRHCYAERFVHRGLAPQHRGLTIAGDGGKGPRWTGDVRLVEERLGEPLCWKKPARVFVNSLSDLFHESVAFETIAAILGVMAAAPHLTFQVLTKRPERAREFFAWVVESAAEMHACIGAPPQGVDERSGFCAMFVDDQPICATREQWRAAASAPWPLPNVWLGVSVEDQRTADERIPVLLELPAALRFVSYEPALGPVDFGMSSATCDCCERWPSRWVRMEKTVWADWPGPTIAPRVTAGPRVYRARSNRHGALSIEFTQGPSLGIKPDEFSALPGLDWIIVGGESGPGARPFDVAWARSTIEQCRSAKVACFVKQLGARPIAARHTIASLGGEVAEPLALRHRKGADPSEWPEDLRVREMPEVVR